MASTLTSDMAAFVAADNVMCNTNSFARMQDDTSTTSTLRHPVRPATNKTSHDPELKSSTDRTATSTPFAAAWLAAFSNDKSSSSVNRSATDPERKSAIKKRVSYVESSKKDFIDDVAERETLRLSNIDNLVKLDPKDLLYGIDSPYCRLDLQGMARMTLFWRN